MEINHTLLLDLQQIGTRQMMQAKQGDSLTRVAKLCLYDGGTEFDVPSGATLQIAYAKADGKGGLYDKMPDGSTACTSSGNIVTAKLHPQMFTVAGLVSCELRLMTSSGEQLSTFSWFITVQASASAGAESEDYFRFATLDGVINDIGDLSKLTTTVKSSLVAAINSVNSSLTDLSKKAVKSVNSVKPDKAGNVTVAAGGLQIVRARHTADDVYTATGDALPLVVPGYTGQHTGKGAQIVFIPGGENTTAAPKLQLNGGSKVQIRMRAPRDRRDNPQSPDATLPVPVGAMMNGVPYTMTFCGYFWLIDSFVHCPTFVVEMTKSSDGTITVDKTFAQIKSAYAAGQQIVCACYDESAQWDERFLLQLQRFNAERGLSGFAAVIEPDQGYRVLAEAYINSGSSGDVYGLSAWEIKDLPNIPTPKASDAGKTLTVDTNGKYVLA